MTDYWDQPCRVMYRVKNGTRTTRGGYGLIARMQREGRLIAAWSTSTGKTLA